MHAEIQAGDKAEVVRAIQMAIEDEKAVRIIVSKSDDVYRLSISKVGDEIPLVS
jgi:hypothetical protein